MDSIPILTLRRLPQYLELLYQFKNQGLEVVSATKLSAHTGVHMTQVRKDIAFTGLVGVPKVGHKTDDLIGAIEFCLNWNDKSSCFLVGAGNLGRALMGYKELDNKGLKIIAAFDTDSEVIGKTINSVPVFSMDKFDNLSERLKVRIGIITVPKNHAQEIADRMVSRGVIAIWNFTPVILSVSEQIIVENVDMSASLAVLSRRIIERDK